VNRDTQKHHLSSVLKQFLPANEGLQGLAAASLHGNRKGNGTHTETEEKLLASYCTWSSHSGQKGD